MANKGNRHLNSFANDTFDEETYRNRVASHVDGNSVSYEDANFVTGDSPAVLDVITDLGRIGTRGHVTNDGPGDMKVEISFDNLTYGGLHTLKAGDVFVLDDLKIRKIRLTWVDNTAYRVLVA